MIEIELKFELKNKINIYLKPEFEKILEDVYYDTVDYQLLKKGNFLRIRNNKRLDFKLNVNDLSHLVCKENSYELSDDNLQNINQTLKDIGLDIKLQAIDDIYKYFKVLAPIKKKRASYRLEDDIILVIDEVEDLGLFLEIELDLNDEQIEDGAYYKNILMEALKKNNLYDDSFKEVHIGYVELYLKKYNYDAYLLGIYKE